MQVILMQDVPNLGKMGSLVKVKDGYGRNYLLPQKKAMLADSKSLTILERQKKIVEAQAAKLRQDCQELAKKLEALSITIRKEAGIEDRLFGSVTKMDIVASLRMQGVKIEKQWIELEIPLKSIGDHEVPVKLHSDVTANLKVTVVAKE